MSLAECVARFRWASHQLDHLDAEVAPLMRAYSNLSCTEELQKDGRVREYTIKGEAPAIPLDLGLQIGDCLHNFRATLDNLAYTVAIDNNPSLSSEERRAVSFPICTQRADFRDVRSKGVIAKLPPRAQAIIQRSQPYKRWKNPDGHPLAVLRVLSDGDKHRAVRVVTARVGPLGSGAYHFGAGTTGIGGSNMAPIPGAKWIQLSEEVKADTKFLRLELPKAYAHVQMYVGLAVSIVIAEPKNLRADGVPLTLEPIRDYIGNRIFPALASFCAAPSDVMAAAVTRIEYPFAFLFRGWQRPK